MGNQQMPGSGDADSFFSRHGFGEDAEPTRVDQDLRAGGTGTTGNASYDSTGSEPTRPLPTWQGETPVQSHPWASDADWHAQPAAAGSFTHTSGPFTETAGPGSHDTLSGASATGVHDTFSSASAPAGTPSGGTPATATLTRDASASTTHRTPKRTLASLAAVAVLAAGVGGGSAVAIDRHLGHQASASAALPSSGSSASSQPTSSSTVTKVVQASGSSVDWTATASNVSTSVVSIIVSSGSSGDEGTGVVIDNAGHIVTNNHVVSSVSGTIKVQVGNALYNATIVGTDPSTDLAVLKADLPSSVQPISFADSSKVVVGSQVMAVGNPLGLSDTVTTGIVSALNRPVVTQQVSSTVSDGSSSGNVYTNAIQTSAPINPGNSGGALVNANGELIGINSSIASLSSSTSSSTQSGNIGIGFAIPSNQVKYIADQLIAKGSAQHAWLGISTTDGSATVGSASVEGAKVAQVTTGTPAASAGLQTGDVIVGLNGTAVDSSNALVAQVRAAQVGQKVTITVVRDGKQVQLSATLGTAPATTQAQSQSQSGSSGGSGSGGSGSDGSGGSDGSDGSGGSGTNPWGQPGR